MQDEEDVVGISLNMAIRGKGKIQKLVQNEVPHRWTADRALYTSPGHGSGEFAI